MKVFIDESGNHNLDYKNNQDPYSVFVLAGIIFEDEDYAKFNSDFKTLKARLFGSNLFVLHTKEITRPSRSKDNLNRRFDNPKFRAEFYHELSELIVRTKFKIVFSLIRKKEYAVIKGLDNKDPYIFGMYPLIDKIVYHSKDQTSTVYLEKRGHVDDIKIKAEYLSIQAGGTNRFKGSYIDSIIDEFTLKDKTSNISGMQLVDLIVTPIGRHYLGKVPKPSGNELPYEIVKTKIDSKDIFIYP